jgi:uncharacterized membrane protein YiaA
MVVNEHTLRTNQRRAPSGVRIKTIALPAEHGGWGFLFEPILLGLLLAPSIGGLYLAFSAVGFFLARHPLTLVMLNRRRASPRTALAKRFAALYLVVGAMSFLAASVFAQHSFVLPLLVAAPLAIVQIAYEWTGHRRVLIAEIAAVTAISSLAAAIAMAGGWNIRPALGLWAIMVAGAVPAILYVRACLDRLRNRAGSPYFTIIIHVAALLLIAMLATMGLVPNLAIAVIGILIVRAVVGMTIAKRLTPKKLGVSEIVFGAMMVTGIVAGYAFEL